MILFLTAALAAHATVPADEAVLLEFRAVGRNAVSPLMQTWIHAKSASRSQGFCTSDNYDAVDTGFAGVMCDDPVDEGGGRVVYVYIARQAAMTGDISSFAPFTELCSLDVSFNPGLTGDIATLSRLSHLRNLDARSTSVYGAPASLVGLTLLGETWVGPDDRKVYAGAFFMHTNVGGSVSALRALPELSESKLGFTACADYATCGALTTVSDVANTAGRDECACCAASTKQRDAGGACGCESSFSFLYDAALSIAALQIDPGRRSPLNSLNTCVRRCVCAANPVASGGTTQRGAVVVIICSVCSMLLSSI